MPFIIDPYRFTSAPNLPALDIDVYSADSPLMAYSLRKISTSYSGEIVRLRRSSDNSELDFGSGLSVGEYLDFASVDAWAGGSSVYVVTWYDQSGNGRDLSQSTAGEQPQLIDSNNGIRSLYGDGISTHMHTIQLAGGVFPNATVTPSFTCHAVIDTDTTNFGSFLAVSNNPNVSGQFTMFRTNRYDYQSRVAWQSVQLTEGGIGTIPTPPSLEYHGSYHDGSEMALYYNNQLLMDFADTTPWNANNDTFHIFKDGDRHEFEGNIIEVVFFEEGQSTADREAVRDNMNDNYSIY